MGEAKAFTDCEVLLVDPKASLKQIICGCGVLGLFSLIARKGITRLCCSRKVHMVQCLSFPDEGCGSYLQGIRGDPECGGSAMGFLSCALFYIFSRQLH